MVRFDHLRRQPVTAAEAGAFLNVSAAAIRKMVTTEGVASVGKRGRAKLYWMHEITEHVGTHDRGEVRKRRNRVTH